MRDDAAEREQHAQEKGGERQRQGRHHERPAALRRRESRRSHQAPAHLDHVNIIPPS